MVRNQVVVMKAITILKSAGNTIFNCRSKKQPSCNQKDYFQCRFLLAAVILLSACGTEGSHESVSGQEALGAYQARLIFPDDISTSGFAIQNLGGIDCKAAQINTIEFTFIINGAALVSSDFPCGQGKALIRDIPVGEGIRVNVYAYALSQQPLFYGYEITAIRPGQVTQSGAIDMQYIDDWDEDGYTKEDDCDDTDFNINPGAAEIPGNDVDENCDGVSIAFRLAELDMEFVSIPAGTFMMGSPTDEPGREDDETRHQVTLTQDYFMQTTEITQGQYEEIMGVNPSIFSSCGENCPVDMISWEDAQQFVDEFNIRYAGEYEFYLPTEAQWEHAARAGSEDAFANGPIESGQDSCVFDANLNTMGWYCDNAEGTTHGVAEKAPNAFGLYDMHGNVWEWCQNRFGDYPADSEIDPQGPSSGSDRVLRGGGYYDAARFCRSAIRFRRMPDSRLEVFGFRLAASLLSR